MYRHNTCGLGKEYYKFRAYSLLKRRTLHTPKTLEALHGKQAMKADGATTVAAVFAAPQSPDNGVAMEAPGPGPNKV